MLPRKSMSSSATPKPTVGRAGFSKTLKLFKDAARRVPAYRDFLQKAGINPELVNTIKDFSGIPTIDKQNYISQYSLKELSWDGSLAGVKYIPSSSGSTGAPFFWPRGEKQDEVSSRVFKSIYENIFHTGGRTALCVNLYALGTWIAGFELYNATKRLSGHNNILVLTTPSIEKRVAVESIKNLGPSFDCVILAGYPPFIKDVIEEGIREGINWKRFDVRCLSGGEAFSEKWRDHVLELIGKENDLSTYVNIYGMAEVGVVGFESPFSIGLRRSVEKELKNGSNKDGKNHVLACENDVLPVYHYDPLHRYIEVEGVDSLILTANSCMPLVRYNTRDRGGILPTQDTEWKYPLVYLLGRKDFSISFYALNIYVENLKRAFENFAQSHSLSGLFTMSIGHDDNMDQRFDVSVELAHDAVPHDGFLEALKQNTVKILCAVNSEYAKLHATLGSRAEPCIQLVDYGQIQTTPGRKHRWIKKD